MKHFVGMAGLRGYMPAFCEVYDSFESTCDSLIDIHDNGWEMLEGDEPGLSEADYGGNEELYDAAWVAWVLSPMYKALKEFEEACGDLRESGFAEIDLHIHGNEYMEVVECNCDAPWEHSEQSVRDTLEYLNYSAAEVEALLFYKQDEDVREALQDYLEVMS